MIGSRSFRSSWKDLVVHPHVLRELELADEARASDERRDAAFAAVIGAPSGRGGPYVPPRRIIRRRFMFDRRVARIHAAYVRAQRHGITVRIHLPIVEVVVALRIGAELRDRPSWARARTERRCAIGPSVSPLPIPALRVYRRSAAGTGETRRRAPRGDCKRESCRSATGSPAAATGRSRRSRRCSQGKTLPA